MENISAGHIEQEIRKIAAFSDSDKGEGVNRLTLSSKDMECRAYFMKEMEKAGLSVSVDGIGNMTGLLQGSHPELSEVWTGSHLDTVRNAGMFDGIAGVVAGLESLRLIKENGIPHKRNLCLKVYTGEEGTRFSMGCIGSRALAGQLSYDELGLIKDEQGISILDELAANHFPVSSFSSIPVPKGKVASAVELHIEQSSNLEKHHKTIGIVDGICAPTNLMVTLTGEQSHAGGTSMEDRRDAFMAAAEISLALEEAAKHGTSAYTTGTVGYVKVVPNAENVIPGEVTLSVDVRDCDGESKEKVVKDFLQKAEEITRRRQVMMKIRHIADDKPGACSPHIMEIIEQQCKAKGISYMHTFSGPYHDSLFISQFAPVGMIFVPSRNGISHSPAEWTDFQDIADGAEVLCSTITALANE